MVCHLLFRRLSVWTVYAIYVGRVWLTVLLCSSVLERLFPDYKYLSKIISFQYQKPWQHCYVCNIILLLVVMLSFIQQILWYGMMVWWALSTQLRGYLIRCHTPYTNMQKSEKLRLGVSKIQCATGPHVLGHRFNTGMLHRSWSIMLLVNWSWLSIMWTRRVTLRLGWSALPLFYLSRKSKYIMGFLEAQLLRALDIHVVKQINSTVSRNTYTFIIAILYTPSFVFIFLYV